MASLFYKKQEGPTMIISNEQVKICSDFAKYAPNNHSNKDHRQSNEKPRKPEDIIRKVFIGKMGEICFEETAKPYFPEIATDWRLEKIVDIADFIINKRAIEVKTIKTIGQNEFLLVEPLNLFYKIKHGQPLPHVFVLAQIKWDEEKDKPTREVNLLGYIWLADLFNTYKCEIYKRGEKLPNQNWSLKAHNFAIHKKNLNTNWAALFEELK
jgi:hypothetical protein